MTKLKPYKKYIPVSYDYIDALPEGWQLLPNIAIFQERKERGTHDEETLSISAIRGIIKSTDYENRKDRTSDDKSQYLLVKDGDLAYNTMLMWDGAVGHSGYRGIVSPAYTVLKPKLKINPQYFHYLMRTELYKNYSRRFSYGIVDARLRLYYVHFKRMYSIFPPVEVQNEIVDYLDRKNAEIDTFIRKKERLIELLEERKGAFVENAISNSNYKVHSLKYLCNMITDGSHFSPNTLLEGCNYVSVSDIDKDDNIDLERCKKIALKDFTIMEKNGCRPKKNDILLTKDGTIGRAFVVKDRDDFVALSSLGIIRPNIRKVNPSLLRYILISPVSVSQMYSKIQGSALTRLTIGLIKNLKIGIPCEVSEQEAIIEEINTEFQKINLAISKAQREIAAIKEYRESLITELVTGKRKVPTTSEN